MLWSPPRSTRSSAGYRCLGLPSDLLDGDLSNVWRLEVLRSVTFGVGGSGGARPEEPDGSLGTTTLRVTGRPLRVNVAEAS